MTTSNSISVKARRLRRDALRVTCNRVRMDSTSLGRTKE
jgi:hypothetical protein